MTDFHEIQFPTAISYGTRQGPRWNTTVLALQSGVDVRNANWADARHQYDVRYSVKTPAQLALLTVFFNARRGRLYGFRYKDWADFSSASDGRATPAPTDQLIGTGNGSQTVFQLVKNYSDAQGAWARPIRKPVSATTRIAVNDVEQTNPTWTFPWSIDATTGIVTFTTAPTASLSVKAGYRFDVPVRFDVDQIDSSLDSDRTLSVATVRLVELRLC